jgi:hypothetical protein
MNAMRNFVSHTKAPGTEAILVVYLISEETDGPTREHPYHGRLGLHFMFPSLR